MTLKGKTYELNDVTTLPELQERLEEVSGVTPKQQGRILWNGQRLTSTASSSASLSSSADSVPLSEVGVKDGDQLNCVPATSGKKKRSNSASVSGATTSAAATAAAAANVATAGNNDDGNNDVTKRPIKDLLRDAGMDTSGMDEVMKMMGSASGGAGGSGGSGGGDGPSLQESMSMMTDMMKSPLFTQLMNDPEKLEESRLMIINNPMLKEMMAGLPGMGELLDDPVAWRQAMQAAASLYQNMDPDDLMNAMAEGAKAGIAGGGMMGGGLPPGMGLPPGLFGNGMMDNSKTGAAAATAALDELSEGEE